MGARPARAVRGFTLLEVVVALAILAVGLSAVIKLGSENASNALYLRDKSFAHWVAMNKVAELQVANTWPEVGEQQGRELVANREWAWRVKVIETPDRDVRRVEVNVHAEDQEESGPLAVLVSFIGRPQ